MRKAILYILLTVLALLIVFIVQNQQDLTLKFLWIPFRSTTSLLLVGFLVAGFVSGWILSRLLELRWRNRKQVATTAPPEQS